MTTQLDNVRKFLDKIFGSLFETYDGFVEIRLLKEAEGARSIWLQRGMLLEPEWQEIQRLNEEGWNVHFGVNPRPATKDKKQDDIDRIVCLWLDVDGKDFPEGGKAEALRRIKDFAVTPSVLVDSGNGYHAYFVLNSPITISGDEDRLDFKKYLSGVVKAVGSDSSKLHLDSCLRLPETKNVKDVEHSVDCSIVEFSSLIYGLSSFDHLKDKGFEDFEADDGAEMPAFGTKNAPIKITKIDEAGAAAEAREQVEKLEVPAQVKRLIITGALPKGKNVDRTASARDFGIICTLIFCGYNYATIHSIFTCPHLGCSSRIRRRGEAILRWDVKKALKKTPQLAGGNTPQSLAIDSIRMAKLTAPQKKKAIGDYIVDDLLLGAEPAGQGFRDVTSADHFLFFDNGDRILMDVDSIDFYCLLRGRFGIFHDEVKEYQGLVKTTIRTMKSEVTPRMFSYFDLDSLTLYVDMFDNQMARITGDEIEICPNGAEGVFFKSPSIAVPFKIEEGLEPVEYFRTLMPSRRYVWNGGETDIPGGVRYGLNLDSLYSEQSLIKKFLVDRAPFEPTKETPLTPEQQQLLLVLYFYSLFFETRMRHKPLACFVGIRESGKSTLSSSIGQILFGPAFSVSVMPKSPHDLAVVLSGAPYYVIDNADEEVKGDMLDTLAAIATGASESNRELFTSLGIATAVPHSFVAITTRTVPFTRDDIVSRLLPLNLKHLESGELLPSSFLAETLAAGRNKLMTEILVNLNHMVRILRIQKGWQDSLGDKFRPKGCLTRLGDWESLSMAVSNFETRYQFKKALKAMSKKKVAIVLEESLFFEVLMDHLESGGTLRNVPAQEVYNRLNNHSIKLGLATEFSRQYKTAKSMMRHVAAIAAHLREEIDFPKPTELRGRKRLWTVKLKGDDRPDAEVSRVGFDDEPE
jgi:hypothetical protein